MNILVTGGAGFIGSHTVVALHEAGHHPVIVDDFRNSETFVLKRLEQLTDGNLTFYEGDCRDENLMTKVFETEKIAGIIHFAAYKAVGESVRQPLKYYSNNIDSLVMLLEVMQRFGVLNFVFSSSCTVYGIPEKLPVTEKSPIQNAASPYGFTKQVGERIVDDVIKADKPLRAATLRYFNPIGAHSSTEIGELPIGKPENLVPYITQTAAGIRDELTIFGKDYDTPDGTCIRDYIHVMDLAEAHVKALEWLNTKEERSLNEVFNLGTGHGNSVKEVVDTFEEVSGVNVSYRYGDRRPGDVPAIFADATKAGEALNWKTKRSLGDALSDAWQWQMALSKNK